MTLIHLVGVVMLGALIAYVLLGGADFGGGVWDLFASGPRARQQRALIEDVMKPVWEVNHIWLIFVIVLMFTGFPVAFATLTTALHIPLTLMLVGVVIRGAAFIFRQYDDRHDDVQRRWGRVFAIASVITPLFLGACLGAVTSGAIHLGPDGAFLSGWFAPWLAPFPIICGIFTLVLFAFIAAVYLTTETDDVGLRADFANRAIISGLALGACALAAGLSAGAHTAGFSDRLFHSSWSIPHQLLTGAASLTALISLARRRYRVARVAAIAQVVLIIVGWGLAQSPYLIAPDLTLTAAAAPRQTLIAALAAVAAGAVMLVPALYWLLKTFHGQRR